MRGTLLGLGLAVAFVVAIFLADYLHSQTPSANPAAAAASIDSNFSGARQIGDWTLFCEPRKPISAPIPLILNTGRAARMAGQSQPFGRCRVLMLARPRSNPKQVIMSVAFRLMGEGRMLTMLVRTPPGSKKGDVLGMRFGSKGLRMSIVSCGKADCLSGGSIPPALESQIFSAKILEFVLPPGPHGHRLGVPLSPRGLAEAVSAMRRIAA
ncbi:MAG TPA: invasion associated locus B family protein [Rhizomicrobium sp.]|jgi:hypothetical protein|nr:invasion associated locus B family protein [Rhizomicrobium sp.]